MIVGAMQVNARVPANAPRGAAVEIVLEVGGIAGPPGATLSIE